MSKSSLEPDIVAELLDGASTWLDVADAIRLAKSERAVSGRQLSRELHVPAPTLARALSAGFASSRDPALVEAVDTRLSLDGRLARAVNRLHGTVALPCVDWVHNFPAKYVGRVWMMMAPASHHVGQLHRVVLNWGPWEVQLPVRRAPARGVVWWFMKGDDGLSVPLFAHVEPAATLEFSTVDRWGGDAINANRGWYRDDD